MRVVDVMTAPVHTVSSGKSVWHASRLMAEYHIGSLVVVDAGTVTGIITSRDVRAAHPNRIVADAMTADPIRVTEQTFLWDALKAMEQAAIERLVVDRHGQAVGIVTREAVSTELSQWLDPLTRMYRSPYIHAIGEDWLSRGESFQLLFIDLNRFGEINKRYGHPVGDDLLRGFADKLRSLFGFGDCLCRYAGDEFAVLTRMDDKAVQSLIGRISGTLTVGPASVSAEVGWLNERREPDWHKLPFRELIARTSLLSSQAKRAANG